MDLGLEEPKEEDPNTDPGNRGNGSIDHKDNGVKYFPIGVPSGDEPGLRGNMQPQAVRRNYLCERFYKIRPPSFEGFTNPLDAEEWLSMKETILDFMELKDDEKIIYTSYVLRKEARYWWEAVKTRRNVLEMAQADFVYKFNKKFLNPTVLGAQQIEFLKFTHGNMTIVEAIKKYE